MKNIQTTKLSAQLHTALQRCLCLRCLRGGTQVCFFLTTYIILNTVHIDADYLT